MIGIIFAAGIGTRLKPFTDFHPKAIAQVGGIPMLVRVATKLQAAGARRIIVNVHHFPEQVKECLASLPFTDIIDVSDESACLLDTGGALAKIARENATVASAPDVESFVVHNADIFTDFPIGGMIGAHEASGADATILVDAARKSTRHFLFDSSGRLRGWENTTTGLTKPEGVDTALLWPAAFGGVHVLSKKVLMKLMQEAPNPLLPFSITDWYINNCGDLDIAAYTPSAPYLWHDIGTPEKLRAADEAAAR